MTHRTPDPRTPPVAAADNSLLEALRLTDCRAVISLVGAGGKTSLALWLMHESRQRDWPVVFTTTTHVQEPVLHPEERLLLTAEPGFPMSFDESLRRRIPLFVAAERSDLRAEAGPGEPLLPGRFLDRKLRGISPADVDGLAGSHPDALFLVEADGARHRLLKAPAEYEPQIPQSSTHLLVVAAADVVGRPLNESVAHRPDRLGALMRVPLHTPITPDLVARALTHPRGGLKGAPADAQVVPVITLVQKPWPLASAREIAHLLLRSPGIGWVLVVALRPSWRVVEVLER